MDYIRLHFVISFSFYVTVMFFRSSRGSENSPSVYSTGQIISHPPYSRQLAFIKTNVCIVSLVNLRFIHCALFYFCIPQIIEAIAKSLTNNQNLILVVPTSTTLEPLFLCHGIETPFQHANNSKHSTDDC